ncbi:uncharacterized protein DNG_08760 [Cephalotrichum gorgonifer]|uniref:Uncharacterized protein n=1 Tax=Cephalotrichum gorgonifer TaxID=2041049 RepID=A0AAE8N465_9PEZI|nr:uncharacterized protein DNG_08760 [Cephalotrichum gorgonifer]
MNPKTTSHDHSTLPRYENDAGYIPSHADNGPGGPYILDSDGNQVAEIPYTHESMYYFFKTRVVEKMPETRESRESTVLGKLTAKLKKMTPAAKAAARVQKREGKYYHIDERGQVIETTVRRAALQPKTNAWIY